MIFRKKSTPAEARTVVAARAVADAYAARDLSAVTAAINTLRTAAGTASPHECQDALAVLLPVVEGVGFGVGTPLVVTVGSVAGRSTDPTVALPVLVERAAGAMETARGLLDAYERLGVDPSDDDTKAAIERMGREHERLGLTENEAYRLAEAFHAGAEWVQPVLFLCQRKDVRLALPQRERLTRAIEPMVDHVDTAHWLDGLLRVVDDEPLVVVHREARTGFRLRISGVGDNCQLQGLLAAYLIGEVPGQPLTSAERAAVTDGEMQPPGGVFERFVLVDAFGTRISTDARPADIPLLDGVRVVVLDSPTYRKGWTAGRAYPLMTPEIVVEQRLSEEETDELLSRVSPAAPSDEEPPPMTITDDLSLPLADERYPELVDVIIRGRVAGTDFDVLVDRVATEFGLSADDAEFAIERTAGGMIRSGNPANEPIRVKDPVAWEAYRRGVVDPSLVRPCTSPYGP
jgi:hypothetical protein